MGVAATPPLCHSATLLLLELMVFESLSVSVKSDCERGPHCLFVLLVLLVLLVLVLVLVLFLVLPSVPGSDFVLVFLRAKNYAANSSVPQKKSKF